MPHTILAGRHANPGRTPRAAAQGGSTHAIVPPAGSKAHAR